MTGSEGSPPCIHGLVIRPGDTLLVAASEPMEQADAELVKQQLVDLLPDVTVVMMLNGVCPVAVYQPHEVTA